MLGEDEDLNSSAAYMLVIPSPPHNLGSHVQKNFFLIPQNVHQNIWACFWVIWAMPEFKLFILFYLELPLPMDG